MDARIEWLTISGDPDAWRSIGLIVADDGLIPLVGTSLRIVERDGDGPGIVGWAVSGIDDRDVEGSRDVQGARDDMLIDGLATTVVEPLAPMFADHDLGASGLDHVVVMTNDLMRTSAAVADATDCELKRVREVGTMKQGFHRIGRGGLIVEIVERPEVEAGPASFWGIVLNVEDLDAACERIGTDLVGAPKDAVQPGRRIATIRDDVGLGLPVALMTP